MSVRVEMDGHSVDLDWAVLKHEPDQWVLTCPSGEVRTSPKREGLEDYAKLLYGNVLVIESSADAFPDAP